jgi:superfamily II DNA/RNA helicase
VELAKASDDPADYEAAVTALRDGARAAFTEISKLRHETAVAKIPSVIDFLHACLDDDGGKIVLFAHHHDVVNAIAQEFGISSVVLTGETGQTDRQAAVDRFQSDPDCKLFIGSITAAGLGITLTASSHVIFAELDWVPGNITQAEDRMHRIGQTNSVLVQHLVLDGSLDAQMARTLIEKQQVIDKALNDRVEVDLVLPEPVKEEEKPATSRITRKEIEKEAEIITAEEIEEVHGKLRILAGVCDFAHSRDMAGFNKFDAPIGHALAEADRLTPKMAILGRKLTKKYHRQLEG